MWDLMMVELSIATKCLLHPLYTISWVRLINWLFSTSNNFLSNIFHQIISVYLEDTFFLSARGEVRFVSIHSRPLTAGVIVQIKVLYGVTLKYFSTIDLKYFQCISLPQDTQHHTQIVHPSTENKTWKKTVFEGKCFPLWDMKEYSKRHVPNRARFSFG